jgi:hypothetical protein
VKVRLADPFGDPLLIGKGDPRIRSLRKEGTGSGGGGGTDEGGDDSADDDSEEEKSEEDDSEEESEEKTEKDPELQKAIRRRDRAIAENRKLKAQLAEKEKAEKKDDEPDPVAEANSRLVRTAAHGVLRGLGVEDKSDRVEILDLLNLSDVDVDDDGADEDAIEEKIETLRRVFGADGKPTRRVPRTTSAKDKGGNSKDTTDPDAARYRRIIGRR